MLERVQPLAARAGAACGRGRPRPRRGRARARSTCRRSAAPRWTGSRCGPPTRRAGCRSSATSPPGRPAARPLAPGEAIGIATGGAVPDGADAVVPIEYVVEHDNAVEIPIRLSAGASVRPRGGDVAAGDDGRGGRHAARAGADRRARRGRRGRGRRARGGRASPCSRRAPSCARRASRSAEARSTSRTPPCSRGARGRGRRRRAARAGRRRRGGAPRRARARARGGRARLLGRRVGRAARSRAQRSSAELGVEEVFWGVAVKPGKPVAFGVRGATLVFGLPGNPVSSLVGFELFVRPAVLALQGAAEPGPAFDVGRLAAPLRRNGARDELVRARSRARRRRGRARAARGPGVAHDRARSCGRRPRPRPSRRG